MHSNRLLPPTPPLVGTSSVLPLSMHPPLPHVLTLQAPPPLQPQKASPGLHLLVPSRSLPSQASLSRRRPRGPTLQAPPSPQPQTTSPGLHLLFPVQCPQVPAPCGRGRGPVCVCVCVCVHVRVRACVRVYVCACARAVGARVRAYTLHALTHSTHKHVCVCVFVLGGRGGVRPQPRGAGQANHPIGFRLFSKVCSACPEHSVERIRARARCNL